MKSWLAVGCLVVGAALGMGVGGARAEVALGAEGYVVDGTHPVGWRGDWTGRFPGATPPVEWSRRVKGITTELKCQAGKPKGEPGTGAHGVEFFTLQDWLVVGPFDVDDPKKPEQDYLNGEAKVAPDAGDKVGDVAWKVQRAEMDTQSSHVHNGGICRNLNVDFVFAFGKFTEAKDGANEWSNVNTKIEGDFNKKVGYGHTYVYSPTGGAAALQVTFAGAACKTWLNGQEVTIKREWDGQGQAKVELLKGWNRLLVKVSCETGLKKGETSSWRFAAYITPTGTVSYESKGIAWMTRVTGRSMSQPIVVGDKIFVGSSISDLLCMSKATGKVLWIRSNTPWDALSEEDRAQYKDIGPLVEQLNAANEAMAGVINGMVSPAGMDSEQQKAMDKKLADKKALEQKVHKAFESSDRKRFPSLEGNEVTSSNATPCSDGKNVYWACGGGMKGTGASVISCWTLEGKHVWSYHEAFGAAEHGLHTSPLLAEGKLIYPACKVLVAFDTATGKIAWRSKMEEVCGNNIQVVKIQGENVIATHHVELFRVKDGSKFGDSRVGTFGDTTPVIENGVMYNTAKFKNWGNYNMAFAAVPLPRDTNDKAKFPAGWEIGAKDAYMPLKGINYVVASPLYVEGIVYNMDMTGGFSAIDVAEKKPLYRLWMDWYSRYDRYLYGSVASPTLGGKNIYCLDDSGCTIIVAPGKEYKQVGRNLIENIQWSGQGGNPCHLESFYTAPLFEGKSIYIKGEEYMYCVRGK